MITLNGVQQTATLNSNGSFSASFDTHALAVTSGGYTISFTYAGDSNDGSATASSTLTVTPAPLTITPTAGQSKVYGAAVPNLTYSPSGFVNGDSASLLQGALGTTATASSPVGTYPFTLGTVTAGANYTLALGPNSPTFAVVAASITVQSVQVNDGSAQRSMVDYLMVTLSGGVVGAFSLADGSGKVLSGIVVNVTAAGTQMIKLTFSNAPGGNSIIGGSLPDGRYQLLYNAQAVQGGNFFRLFGDCNGDGKVDSTDAAAFLAAYRSFQGQANYR
jgi:hypothetical protein